ncbi:MAG: UDP-3-O-(3-hydroxymyristoyl)glucosamine N-acyltransferase [Ignavibacteria bacterium]|nr:UDP-3-O-(3-hydroxymyristoyl)glucosamine N-acyltransferase [Ignavibacteria bacterium]
MKLTVEEIAATISGEVVGDGELEICNIAKIEDAKENEISFVGNSKYEKYIAFSKAAAIIVSRSFQTEGIACTFVKVDEPYRAFLRVVELFHTSIQQEKREIHPTSIIGNDTTIGKNVSIGAYVVIGERCDIGNDVTILSHTVLEDDVRIGEQSYLYSNISIREKTEIGKRVILHSGTVIGSDGFGFVPNEDGSLKKIPQVGRVVIEDDVEIGANCAIDRATLGDTRIKSGTKLDNLIQIAHNVIVGEHTVIAAQTGISGSTKIGKHCVIGGQVGIAGHIEIEERTTIGAQSGVTKPITTSGKIFSGYPAKEHTVAKRLEVSLRQVPSLIKEVEELKKKIATII